MKRCPCGAPGEQPYEGKLWCPDCIQIVVPRGSREETYRRLKAKAKRPEIQSGKLKKGKK